MPRQGQSPHSCPATSATPTTTRSSLAQSTLHQPIPAWPVRNCAPTSSTLIPQHRLGSVAATTRHIRRRWRAISAASWAGWRRASATARSAALCPATTKPTSPRLADSSSSRQNLAPRRCISNIRPSRDSRLRPTPPLSLAPPAAGRGGRRNGSDLQLSPASQCRHSNRRQPQSPRRWKREPDHCCLALNFSSR
jgi:hypothetical protein